MQIQETFSILLVDDDPTVVRILSHILGGIQPLRFATSGHLALKLARESVPDLVLLDIDMPELSGFEVCKQFKSDPKLAEVPIIFITSHESPQLETLGLQLGAVDFISKPPHASLVLARVRTYQRLKTLSDTLHSAVKMDFLTGAVTRRQLEKALNQEWLRAQRSEAPLAVMLVDIDGFTAYDAEFGEDQGNACLHGVADALRSVGHRPTDVLGRYAGGKFALLLPETDADGAGTVAQRAIDAVDGLQILHAASTGKSHITVSVGGACLGSSPCSGMEDGAKEHPPLEEPVPDDLLEAAERALRGARSAGGHQARLLDIASAAALIRHVNEERRVREPEPVAAGGA
jgi:diguanylate cyclase (GGDEF)-like protein